MRAIPSIRPGLFAGPWIRAALLCILLGSFAHRTTAQTPPARMPQTRSPSGAALYSAEGRIVSEDGRSPIPMARVTLSDINGRHVGTLVTDDEGTFAFYELPAGLYILNVTHAQFDETNERVEITVTPLRGLRVVLRSRNPSGRRAETINLDNPSHSVPVWALKIPSEARKEYEAGVKELKAGEWKKCATQMEAALALYPQYATAYSTLGTAQFRLNHLKAAEDAYASALKIDEGLLDANLGLGSLYSANKRYPDAEKLLQRANKAKPDEWSVLYELGQLYWRMENLGAAEQHLVRARVLHPEFARIHLLLMNVLSMQNKLPESLEVMEDYLQRFPKDPFAPQVKQKRDQLKNHLAAPPPPAQPKP